jgi:hypothetical protein
MRLARVISTGLLAGGLAALAAALSYPLWRSWCLTWGATEDEAGRELPGDELLSQPDVVTTRAVAISAPPAAVWPWLVQMGPGRAGAYTYDWIENLAGLDMHSADDIVPEYQHMAVGDSWKLGPKGAVLRVASMEEASSIVLRSSDGNWVWAFLLHPDGDGCRLVSRNRIRWARAPFLWGAAVNYAMEPGSLVMERKMLLGIKQRAERRAGASTGAET